MLRLHKPGLSAELPFAVRYTNVSYADKADIHGAKHTGRFAAEGQDQYLIICQLWLIKLGGKPVFRSDMVGRQTARRRVPSA